MAYCGKCGTLLSDGMKYCPKCGNPCGDESGQLAETKVEKQKNSSKVLTKAFLMVFLTIAFIGCVWIVWNKQSSKYSLEKLAEIIPNYDCIDSFHEGIAIGSKGDKHGYFNMQGEVITPCIYEKANHFVEGRACVKKNGKWGFIDYTGKEIIPCMYDEASSYSEGLAIVEKDNKVGYIDKEGKTIIPFIYGFSHSFSEGLAAVSTEEGYKYIDKTGKVVLSCDWDNGAYWDFKNGLAPKMVGDTYGYIDKTGKMVIPALYYNYRSSMGEFKDGLAIVMRDDNRKSEVIDVNGKNVLGFEFDGYAEYNDGVILIHSNEECSFYNTEGEKIIDKNYKNATPFSEGLASVTNGDGSGYIDKTGKMVIPAIFDEAFAFSEGLAVVKKDGEYGYIDKKGNSTFYINDVKLSDLAVKKESSGENVQEENIKQEEDKEQEGNENTVVQQDYKNEIMPHVSAIQQIMEEINSIHNRCVSVSIQNPNQVMGVNAVADISELTIEGDRHFRQMISIARKAGRQEDINTIRQEMEDFDYKSNQMKQNILRLNDDMYQ